MPARPHSRERMRPLRCNRRSGMSARDAALMSALSFVPKSRQALLQTRSQPFLFGLADFSNPTIWTNARLSATTSSAVSKNQDVSCRLLPLSIP
jgi:hypothetical protein